MIDTKLKWKIHYLWLRAQGFSVREVVENQWKDDMPTVRIHNWAQTVLCFVYLAAIRLWRLLPGLWVLVRYGRFMFRLWRQWTDFEGRPLSSWPEIKRKAMGHSGG